MKFKILILFLLCTFVIAEDYENIDLSVSKKKLSNEIFKKLEKEHYIKKIDKEEFNEKYVKAIFIFI